MEYKVIIDTNGTITTDVVNRGVHKCEDIINVVNSFGTVIEKKKKEDHQPVFDKVSIKG